MKRAYKILIAIGALIFVGGVAYWAYLYNCEDDWCATYEWQKVRITNNFGECVGRGFSVTEISPRECRAGKKVFTESLADTEASKSKESSMPESMVLNVFFGSEKIDPKSEYCDKSYPVTRHVPKTFEVAKTALEELLKGPTDGERSDGYRTAINAGVKVQKIDLKNGVLMVDFDSTLDREVAGSCRVIAIRSQITETLKQFPAVKEVIISVNGRTADILQP